MHAGPDHELATVVKRLETSGANRVVVVPLLVSSFSNHFEEIRYYIGDRYTAPEHAHSVPLKTTAKFVMTQAMDDHELVSGILIDATRQISSNPSKESVVLVAHGPNGDEDNARWLEKLNHHAQRLQQTLPFKRVEVTTLRDDAPTPVRDAATERLRSLVSNGSKDSRVLVVPVLISVGRIQTQIKERLTGLEFRMAEFGIASHANTRAWIREQGAKAIEARSAD
jgi:sirohydrochlorin ferrochelatase